MTTPKTTPAFSSIDTATLADVTGGESERFPIPIPRSHARLIDHTQPSGVAGGASSCTGVGCGAY